VRIVFVLGGPGSGKGTQCAKIVDKYGFTHLSAGDLLRDEVNSGSVVGKQCEAIMKEGKLVPMEVGVPGRGGHLNKTPHPGHRRMTTGQGRRQARGNPQGSCWGAGSVQTWHADRSGARQPRACSSPTHTPAQLPLCRPARPVLSHQVIIGLLRAAMIKSGAKDFLIDGFPRAMDQAVRFEEMIKPCETVIFFDCPEEVMEARLLKRGETSGRSDDNAETIRKRFRTFVDQSLPVIDHYHAQGKAHKISATAAPEEVFGHVQKAIDALVRRAGAVARQRQPQGGGDSIGGSVHAALRQRLGYGRRSHRRPWFNTPLPEPRARVC
jgi:adenylate kinase family enzyme